MTHLRPVLNDPTHFEVSQHQSQDSLLPSPSSLLHRHRDVRDELPVASKASPSAGHTDLPDETDAITVSDSSASRTDTGVHWDFSSRSSARRIKLTSHLKGIKEEDGAREVETGFIFLPVIMQRNRPSRDIMLRLLGWRASATA